MPAGGDVIKLPWGSPSTRVSLTGGSLPLAGGVAAAADGTVYATRADRVCADRLRRSPRRSRTSGIEPKGDGRLNGIVQSPPADPHGLATHSQDPR